MSDDTDTEDALAASAYQHFKERKYDASLECLNKLRSKGNRASENDPKILHNIALVVYCIGGKTDPQSLLDHLSRVKGIIVENALNAQSSSSSSSSSSPPPPPSSSPSSSSPPPNNDDASHQQQQDDVIPTNTIPTVVGGGGGGGGEIDSSLLKYNQSVILYHTKQYASSLDILKSLFKDIEPIEDYLAVRICMLLMDLYVILRLPEKGLSVLAYLEKMHVTMTKPSTSDDKGGVQDKQDLEDSVVPPRIEPVSPSRYPPSFVIMTSFSLIFHTLTPSTSPLYSHTHFLSFYYFIIFFDESQRFSYDSPTKALSLAIPELEFVIHLYKSKLYLLDPSTLHQSKQEIEQTIELGAKLSPLTSPFGLFLKAHLEYLLLSEGIRFMISLKFEDIWNKTTRRR